MIRFELKDGREATIHTWNFQQLKKYVSKDLSTSTNGMLRHFNGFRFLGPNTAYEMEILRVEIKYEKEKTLSPLEIQPDRSLPKEKYHKSLVALIDEEVCGIAICQWIKDSMPFWRYHIKLIDVNEKFRNLGVGTNLVKALDKAVFLDSKIIQDGRYTEDGKKYIQKAVQRELKGERYAFIPNDYLLTSAPRKKGIYDAEGKLKH